MLGSLFALLEFCCKRKYGFKLACYLRMIQNICSIPVGPGFRVGGKIPSLKNGIS